MNLEERKLACIDCINYTFKKCLISGRKTNSLYYAESCSFFAKRNKILPPSTETNSGYSGNKQEAGNAFSSS